MVTNEEKPAGKNGTFPPCCGEPGGMMSMCCTMMAKIFGSCGPREEKPDTEADSPPETAR